MHTNTQYKLQVGSGAVAGVSLWLVHKTRQFSLSISLHCIALTHDIPNRRPL